MLVIWLATAICLCGVQGNAPSVLTRSSPQNRFEAFLIGMLSGGSATVTPDPGFAQTVNTTVDYHVYHSQL